MIIDLKRLKLHPQESEEFHLQAAGRDELLKELGGRFAAPIKLDLRLANTGREICGHGMVHTILELLCSRCLKAVLLPVDAGIYLSLLEANNNDEIINEDNEDIVFFKQSEVDIQPRVEEVIFMNLPLNPLCNENCKGICPACGVDRNQEECRCDQEETDPRWDKLKNLK